MKEWGSSRTRIEQFVESDLDDRIDARVAPRQSKDDQINAARQSLGICWFDEAACSEGLSSLRGYRKDWDEERGVWKDKPRHDWASHGADALQCLAVTWREIREEPPPESLEARMKREQAELAEAVEKFSRPKTLSELLEEYDDETAMAEN